MDHSLLPNHHWAIYIVRRSPGGFQIQQTLGKYFFQDSGFRILGFSCSLGREQSRLFIE
jgi:hypothetical protein